MIYYFHITVILSVILSGVFLLRRRKGISVHHDELIGSLKITVSGILMATGMYK